MLVMDLISFFSSVRYYYSDLLIQQLVPLIMFFILVVLYVIQMIVRPRSVAMPVIFLVMAVLYIIVSLVMNVATIRYANSYMVAATVISWFAEIFAFVAYIIAMFSSRKR